MVRVGARTWRPRLALTVGLASACLLGANASAAFATTRYIYWSDYAGAAIGRAALSGEAAEPSFIRTPNNPNGIATYGSNLYWSLDGPGLRIARSTLEGGELDQSLFSTESSPYGVAVGAQGIFWSNYDTDTIGHATLAGAQIDNRFVQIPSNPYDIVLHGKYLYWSNILAGTVGRATTKGTGVEDGFVSVGGWVGGVGVVGRYLYWSNILEGTIGRMNLETHELTKRFITGAAEPFGIVSDGKYLYWANRAGSIGRARLNGTGVNQTFIGGLGATGPIDVAIAPKALGAVQPRGVLRRRPVYPAGGRDGTRPVGFICAARGIDFPWRSRHGHSTFHFSPRASPVAFSSFSSERKVEFPGRTYDRPR